MARVNILLLFYGSIIYCIKIAYSDFLDLNNLDDSEFHRIKIVENGITKTLIISTQNKPITRICRGNVVIWSALPGESAKCVTQIRSKWSSEVLMTIEINNPTKTAMYYLRKHHHNYKYISLQEFESRYRDMVILSKQLDLINEQNMRKKELVTKTKQKKPKKRKAETDDTGEPEKKIRRQPTETTEPQQQPPLVPETIHFEISDSEDETIDQYEPLDLSQHFKKPTQPSHPFAPQSIHFEISSDDDEFDDDEEEPLDLSIHQEPLDLSIKPKPTETTTQQQLVPVTTTVEMESNKDTQIEEPTEEQRKQQRKFLMESSKKKIQHRIEGKSKKLGPETIQFEVSSDEEESDISDKELLFSSSDTEDEPELISEQTPMIVISDSEDEQEPGKKGDLPDKEKS